MAIARAILADCPILVLDGGHIVKDGTHEELVAAGGEYAGLWGRRTGAFLETE